MGESAMDRSKRPVLDEFGTMLMQDVRDDTCDFLIRLLGGRMRDKSSKELYREFQAVGRHDYGIVSKILTAAVDGTVARFLHFIEAHELKLVFRDKAGKEYDVCSISDGLTGELYTEDGWIERFSKYPHGLALDE